MLRKNEDNVEASLMAFAPFARLFANVAGNGPWLDGYIFNLPPLPAGEGRVTTAVSDEFVIRP